MNITFNCQTEQNWINLGSKLENLLDQETIHFLKTRPWWNQDHDQLQEILVELVPDTHLVAAPDDNVNEMFDEFLLRLADENVILKKMKTSLCHDNSKKLLCKRKIKEMHTGYALSSDRRWRYHSWGIDSEDRIVETTVPRLIYISGMVYKLIN